MTEGKRSDWEIGTDDEYDDEEEEDDDDAGGDVPDNEQETPLFAETQVKVCLLADTCIDMRVR